MGRVSLPFGTSRWRPRAVPAMIGVTPGHRLARLPARAPPPGPPRGSQGLEQVERLGEGGRLPAPRARHQPAIVAAAQGRRQDRREQGRRERSAPIDRHLPQRPPERLERRHLRPRRLQPRRGRATHAHEVRRHAQPAQLLEEAQHPLPRRLARRQHDVHRDATLLGRCRHLGEGPGALRLGQARRIEAQVGEAGLDELPALEERALHRQRLRAREHHLGREEDRKRRGELVRRAGQGIKPGDGVHPPRQGEPDRGVQHLRRHQHSTHDLRAARLDRHEAGLGRADQQVLQREGTGIAAGWEASDDARGAKGEDARQHGPDIPRVAFHRTFEGTPGDSQARPGASEGRRRSQKVRRRSLPRPAARGPLERAVPLGGWSNGQWVKS